MALKCLLDSHQVKYEGCMKRTDNSGDFEKVLTLNKEGKESPVDVQACVKQCWLRRNKIAAMEVIYINLS